VAVKWKYFAGAAVLAVALLLPYAPVYTLIGGIVLAAIVNWKLRRP